MMLHIAAAQSCMSALMDMSSKTSFLNAPFLTSYHSRNSCMKNMFHSIVVKLSIWSLIGFEVKSTCPNDAPISAEIIGKRHSQDVTCDPVRWPYISIVQVNVIYILTRMCFNPRTFCSDTCVSNSTDRRL